MSALNIDPQRLDAALDAAIQALMSERSPDGPWSGELSTSALSTATAVGALALARKAWTEATAPAGTDKATATPDARIAQITPLIDNGLLWLSRHANGDGGWGDTDRSLSNISTTALCWSAFGMVPGADEKYRSTVDAAEKWLKQKAGRLEPHFLATAIIQRYGKDRTFSVPILTMCALAGRLGKAPEAWDRVPALPFELAVLPRQWFAALKLPVVSYALPALIAFGQARHAHLPSRNPLLRLIRIIARRPSLRVLEQIQPLNGGFLEATPLTSFVVMALASTGVTNHPVVNRGIQFLIHSVRSDGSWPIDTNLTTWVTTLAINAIEPELNQPKSILKPDACAKLGYWILRQQNKVKHPYTQSPPGGWAWTDLPGGVPDADDTAGALIALRRLGQDTPEVLEAAVSGIQWLMGLQNKDGGIPTFCRGWGALPFDRSGPDLTAHALCAWTLWLDALEPQFQAKVQAAISRAVKYLINAQREDGAWIPLWFGNQFNPKEENPTYGTARVLRLLPQLTARSYMDLVEPLNDGAQWLVKTQRQDGSWGGSPDGPSSVEETALAVEALAALIACPQAILPATLDQVNSACTSGAHWLVQQIESSAWRQPAPIGFYFAKLWYYERLYPLIFTAGALRQVRKLV